MSLFVFVACDFSYVTANMGRLHYVLSALVLFIALHVTVCKIEYQEKPVERPLHIAAFNIQKLGSNKFANENVMKYVRQILLRYDLVLIQEIVTTDDRLMQNLLQDLNSMAPPGTKYEMSISPRLGRDRAKEQYAYLYRAERLRLLAKEVYPDPEDIFMRPPFINHFATPTLNDMKSLIAIGIHTQPKNAANETSKLAAVYDYASETYGEQNAVLLGDMNAGCQNVRIGDWDNIELWEREEFQWLIKHDTDTTVSPNCCPYDRIVIAGGEMSQAVIYDSVYVYNFREAYGLSTQEALNISDHWPVEVKLRGKVSKDAKKHVSARVCVVTEDDRKISLPAEVGKRKTTVGFQIENTETSTTLYTREEEAETILSSFSKLANKYPRFISKEIYETVSYKVSHGAAEDKSSYTDPQASFSLLLEFDKEEKTIEIHFCSETTIN